MGKDEIQLGTTIMATTFDGGVILAADSRTSSGSYVANRAAAKLTQLAENLYICRSGSASDTQAVASYVTYYLAQHAVELGSAPSVATGANIVKSMVYQNKEMLSCGLIVAGWDRHKGGQVYAVPMGGTLLQVPYAIGGSGSAYITGFFDKYWKAGMSEAECEDFCKRAVAHAFARDASSGGCIRMVVVTEDAARWVFVPHDVAPVAYGEQGVKPWQGWTSPEGVEPMATTQ